MRFASEVKTFSKWFGKRDIRDGAAISKAAQRRLQRVGVTAGFDNHIGTLLAGQRFDLFAYVSANGVKAEIRTVATGNITAMGDRIDANYHRCASAFRQLDGNLTDRAKPYHHDKIPYAYVGIAHAAHGKLRRVVTDGVFPGAALRHFAQLVVIHCVNDDRLGERAVAAYAVAHRVVGNVAAALDNVANHHVAKLEFAKLNAARRICRTRGEHLPLAVKVFIDKRAGGTEVDHFRSVFRCAETHADLHFIG